MKQLRFGIAFCLVLLGAIFQAQSAVASYSSGGLKVTDWTCYQPDPILQPSWADSFIGNLLIDKAKSSVKGKNTTLTFSSFHFSNMKGEYSQLGLSVYYKGTTYFAKVFPANINATSTPVKFSTTLPTAYLDQAEFGINLQKSGTQKIPPSSPKRPLNASCIPTVVFNSR